MDHKPRTSTVSSSAKSELESLHEKHKTVSELTSNEKNIVINVYKYIIQKTAAGTEPSQPSYEAEFVEKTANILGINVVLTQRIVKEYQNEANLYSPEYTKSAIRKKVHSYYLKRELPTVDELLQAVYDDEKLPNYMKRSTLKSILIELKFKYMKRQGRRALIERNKLVLWRRGYLNKIRSYREENRPIYFLGETCVNEGYIVDKHIKSKQQAFLGDQSVGAKKDISKEKRLNVVHIGGEDGFVPGAELIFESAKTTEGYQESMNAEDFEGWMKETIDKLPQNSAIVMNDAPHHSRKIEKVPNRSWTKLSIQNWLASKNIAFDEIEVKPLLMERVNLIKKNYQAYHIDEYAKTRNIEILRLPPYHLGLNPIEQIWANLKDFLKTFRLPEVKRLIQDAIKNVDAETWKKCFEHTKKEEEECYEIDGIVEELVDSMSPESSDTESIHYSDTESDSSSSTSESSFDEISE